MWQVSGRSDITDFEEVVRLDKEYIENWDIGLDINGRNFYLYLLMLPITTIIGNILKYWIASKMFPVCNINAIEKLNESYLDEIKRKVKALFLHKIGGTISNSFWEALMWLRNWIT